MSAKHIIGDNLGWQLKRVTVEEAVRDIEHLRSIQASSSSPYQEQIDHANHIRGHLVQLYQHAFDGTVDNLVRRTQLDFAKHKPKDESALAALFLVLGDDFDDDFAAAMRQAGSAGYSFAEQAMGKSNWGDLKERAEEFGKLRAPDLTNAPEEVIEKLRTDILLGLKNKENPLALARRVSAAADATKETIGERVAETEATITMGTAVDSVMTAAGFTHKRWLSQRDDRVRDSHEECDKQGWIPIGKTFVNGLKYPGQADAPIEEVINCRCVLIGEVRK